MMMLRKAITCIALMSNLIVFPYAVCNTTKYDVWLNKKYQGILSTDSSFWRYQTQTEIVLTNYLALEQSVAYCKKSFGNLLYFKAGRSGPVSIQDAYRVMCNSYCLESDKLHQDAMSISSCSCIELSTQPSDPSFIAEGDWCQHNSARILCNMLDYCGIWNCRLSDFMCPRYEWNKKYIPLKAHGTCIRGAASTSKITPQTILLTVSLTMLTISIMLFPL